MTMLTENFMNLSNLRVCTTAFPDNRLRSFADAHFQFNLVLLEDGLQVNRNFPTWAFTFQAFDTSHAAESFLSDLILVQNCNVSHCTLFGFIVVT